MKLSSEYIKSVFSFFNASGTVLPKRAVVHFYHHKGIENIGNTGGTFFNVVNRDYCKSYVVMLPHQKYPNHYHRIKSESFYVLHGVLRVIKADGIHLVSPGELLNVERGEDHLFESETGCLFEELSTKYVPNDSIYIDSDIAKTSYADRRTTLSEDLYMEFLKQWEK